MVNGNKLWTSGAEAADYIWLAARTDPNLPRHKGISILILTPRRPAFSHTVIPTCNNPTCRHLLRRQREGSGGHAGGQAQRWLAAGHLPAQPRAARPGAWSDKVVGLFAASSHVGQGQGTRMAAAPSTPLGAQPAGRVLPPGWRPCA